VLAVNREIIRRANGSGGSVLRPTAGTPGPDGIAYYPLDGSTADGVGHADLTVVGGATYADGKAGKGMAFNGNGQYLEAAKPVLDTAADYTAAAWVKLNKADGAFQTVVSQDGPQSSDFYLQYSGADQRFAVSFPGLRAVSPVKPEVGRWYHLVGVRDAANSQLRLYVDGALAATQTVCQPFTKPTGHTVIGRGKYNGNLVDYLDGTVDQVHMYDRALSAAEVKALNDSGRCGARARAPGSGCRRRPASRAGSACPRGAGRSGP
jgi:hypothetical protein